MKTVACGTLMLISIKITENNVVWCSLHKSVFELLLLLLLLLYNDRCSQRWNEYVLVFPCAITSKTFSHFDPFCANKCALMVTMAIGCVWTKIHHVHMVGRNTITLASWQRFTRRPQICFENKYDFSINPRPLEPVSVTCPQSVGGCKPLIFFVMGLYPYFYYQCVAFGLRFPLIPK